MTFGRRCCSADAIAGWFLASSAVHSCSRSARRSTNCDLTEDSYGNRTRLVQVLRRHPCWCASHRPWNMPGWGRPVRTDPRGCLRKNLTYLNKVVVLVLFVRLNLARNRRTLHTKGKRVLPGNNKPPIRDGLQWKSSSCSLFVDQVGHATGRQLALRVSNEYGNAPKIQ